VVRSELIRVTGLNVMKNKGKKPAMIIIDAVLIKCEEGMMRVGGGGSTFISTGL
jgi:hypothetical protein